MTNDMRRYITNEKNALVELAERLKCHDCRDDDFYFAVGKAQRIIAELATVPNISQIPIWNCRELEAIRKCREIAEEVEENEKRN